MPVPALENPCDPVETELGSPLSWFSGSSRKDTRPVTKPKPALVNADSGLDFWGASFVADPCGTVLRRASHDHEEVLVVSCDPRQIEETRRHWPFLRDRRIDAYAAITKRLLDG